MTAKFRKLKRTSKSQVIRASAKEEVHPLFKKLVQSLEELTPELKGIKSISALVSSLDEVLARLYKVEQAQLKLTQDFENLKEQVISIQGDQK